MRSNLNLFQNIIAVISMFHQKLMIFTDNKFIQTSHKCPNLMVLEFLY